MVTYLIKELMMIGFKQKAVKYVRPVFMGMAICSMTFIVAGCSMDSPTSITEKRAEVVKGQYQKTFAVEELNTAALEAMANDFRSYGAGDMLVTVTYNPHSKHSTARQASENAARIASFVTKRGVSNVKTEIMPVNSTHGSQVLVNFTSYTARPPEGCHTVFDVDDEKHRNFFDYDLGCSNETYMAKQVARPQDLLGVEGESGSLGRRQGNVPEAYSAGEPNEALEGFTTTGGD